MDFIFFRGLPLGLTEAKPRKSPAERKDEILGKIFRMPLEIFHTREVYNSWKSKKLAKELESRGLDPKAFDSREEMIEALVKDPNDTAGSSGDSCGICISDYEDEDVLRILNCGHKFHVECVDQWAMEAIAFSKPVSCPFCNEELD